MPHTNRTRNRESRVAHAHPMLAKHVNRLRGAERRRFVNVANFVLRLGGTAKEAVDAGEKAVKRIRVFHLSARE